MHLFKKVQYPLMSSPRKSTSRKYWQPSSNFSIPTPPKFSRPMPNKYLPFHLEPANSIRHHHRLPQL